MNDFLQLMQELDSGRARRRFSSISLLQYLQMPYVPFLMRSIALSRSRSVASRVRSNVRLALYSSTSAAFSSSFSPKFWKVVI